MFNVAGVSRCKGVFKVRFAATMDRVKVLVKTGHDEIELMELPSEMDKPQAVEYLKTTNLMDCAEYRAAIEAADAKYNGAKVKVEKPAKASKPKADKPAKTVKVAGVKVRVKADKPAKAAEPVAEPAKGNWFEKQFAAEIAADAETVAEPTEA